MSSESLSDALSEFSDDPVMDLDGNIIEEEQPEEPQETARDNGVEEDESDEEADTDADFIDDDDEEEDDSDDSSELPRLREMQGLVLDLERTIRKPASKRHHCLVRALVHLAKQ